MIAHGLRVTTGNNDRRKNWISVWDFFFCSFLGKTLYFQVICNVFIRLQFFGFGGKMWKSTTHI